MDSQTAQRPRLWGEYEHQVDERGRVVMPQELRDNLGQEFAVLRGPDRSLLVLPMDIWQQIESKVDGHVLNRRVTFLQRMVGGRSIQRLDNQFRLAVPKHLRDYANIRPGRPAVLVGCGNKLEIWDKDAWDAWNVESFTSERVYMATEAVGLAQAIG